MIELSPSNAVEYLLCRGILPPGTEATAEVLAWGVSNQVLRVSPEQGADLVLKQSREQLRTRADWFSRLDRIYREVEVMKKLGELLPTGVVPAVLFEVREDYLFGMEAIAAGHMVWKGELLAGRFDVGVASKLGDYLATIHRQTGDDESLRRLWEDRTVFDELRIDPFYRRIAHVHPVLRQPIDRLIDETLGNAICVVLADFSPKNVLITATGISLVDFETGHYGDPAFDLGFFLSHLLLKTVLHASRRGEVLTLARVFWSRYRERWSDGGPGIAEIDSDLERRAMTNLGACMLARIDGKSPVDYLPQPSQQDFVRKYSLKLLLDAPATVENAFELLEGSLND